MNNLLAHITKTSPGAKLGHLPDVTGNKWLDEVSLLRFLLDSPEIILVNIIRVTTCRGKATESKRLVLKHNLSNLQANGYRWEPVIANSLALSEVRDFILSSQDQIAIIQSQPFQDLIAPFDETKDRIEAIAHIWADADFVSQLYSQPANTLTKDERSLLTGVGRRYFYAGIGADEEEETKDRMKAVEMLGKLDGDFVESTRTSTMPPLTINIGGGNGLTQITTNEEEQTAPQLIDIA